MNTREDATRLGNGSMGWGCGLGIVFAIVMAVMSAQANYNQSSLGVVIEYIFVASLFLFVAGLIVRLLASTFPTARSVAQKKEDKQSALKQAREKAERDELLKQERAERAAAQAEEERKQAQEERRRQEQAERERQNLKQAREAPPDEW